jgi:hypothetical protein
MSEWVDEPPVEVRRADLDFYFDPVCPFAWLTSKWVRLVADQRDYVVDWRFISLRMLNAHIDYDAHFPPEYEAGHTAGLRLLRVAARARAEYGQSAVGPLYLALGRHIFDTAPDEHPAGPGHHGTRGFLEPILTEAGLPIELAEALDDDTSRRNRSCSRADRQGRRHPDPAVPPTRRGGVLRTGDQPIAHT